MVKTLSKLGILENCTKTPTYSITVNDERLNAYPYGWKQGKHIYVQNLYLS